MIAQAAGEQGAGGKIVTISSISAYTASVNRGGYCIAKAGLSMLTQFFAARLAEFGINVYEIRPGVIQTDMTGPVKAKYDKLIFEGDLTPIKRWGQPDDIGKAVVAIATDLLPFSTGQVLSTWTGISSEEAVGEGAPFLATLLAVFRALVTIPLPRPSFGWGCEAKDVRTCLKTMPGGNACKSSAVVSGLF